MNAPLTFVIVARNEASNLPRLVRSIRAACAALDDTPMVLVDHASRDNTAEAAREAGVQRVILSQAPTIAAARNEGGYAVSTDWMAFIDADCELAPDWFEHLLPHLASPGILGWPVRPPEPTTWVQSAWHAHWMAKAAEISKQSNMEFRLITTANMVIHRSVWEQLGGFDPALSSGEDQNLMLRAMKAGAAIRTVPSLTVFHHGEPATLGDYFRQQLWHANRGSYRRIAQQTGLRQGANAPLFTVLFLLSLLAGLAGLVLGGLLHPALLLLCLPWPTLVVLPALRTAWRTGKLSKTLPLSALYAAYGLARSIDLIGLNPAKKSWRVQ